MAFLKVNFDILEGYLLLEEDHCDGLSKGRPVISVELDDHDIELKEARLKELDWQLRWFPEAGRHSLK